MTKSLLALIFELQALKPLKDFSLAGGTNLAIRFKHRESIDHQKDPLNDINVLLAFDTEEYKRSDNSHNHSDDRLSILDNSKTWQGAKASWRKKVRRISHLFI